MKTKFYFFTMLITMSILKLTAQSHYAEWTRFLQTNEHGNSTFNNILYDGADLIVNGHYFGSGIFLGVDLPGAGGANALIAKLTVDGTPLWTTTVTGNDLDVFYDMVQDSDNNIILAGWTSSKDTVRVNGEPVIFNDGQWINHGMVMKLSAIDGSMIWFRSFAGQEYCTLSANRIAVDENDEIYVTGYYNCPFQLDGVSFPYDKMYGDDVFALKLNKDGSALWGQSYTAVSDGGYAMIRSIVSGSDALYFSFEYYKPFIINGEPLPYSGEYYWLALTKMSKETGAITKVFTFGSDGGQTINQIKADNEGNIIAVGFFSSDTPLTIGNITLEGIGQNDSFVLKTDSDLNPIWAKSFGTQYEDRPFNVNTDANNHIYIGGGFDCYSEFMYDGKIVLPGRNPNSLSNYLIVADKSGDFIQAVAIYGNGNESVLTFTSKALTESNNQWNVFCVGNFYDYVEFVEGVVEFGEHNTGYIYKWILPPMVSVNAIEINNGSEVFPNPFMDNLKINFIGKQADVAIYDMQGSLILSQSIDQSSLIALEGLKTGIYLLQLNTEKTVQTFKIIKN